MTVRTHHRIRRIVKRTGALPAYAAGLPVVVFVEAAHPAIAIHWHVEMHFVAAGAEFRNLFTHERFQESAAVRLGIHFHHEVVQRAHYGIFARRQFMQLWIFENEIALAHGAFHVDDAVAHHAAQASLPRWSVLNLPDRRIEHSAEEQCWVVATRAPLRRSYAGDVLHVFDAFAIPLIVERGKMVGRAIPLLVHIFVAAFAGL